VQFISNPFNFEIKKVKTKAKDMRREQNVESASYAGKFAQFISTYGS
jgi:hypothetical protein